VFDRSSLITSSDAMTERIHIWHYLSDELRVCLKMFHQTTVVFDGYNIGPTIKGVTHLQQPGGIVGL